jgi:hypothetical protein
MGNLFFLSFQSPAFRFLATPSHRQKQSPDMIGMVLNPKVLPNYLRDPLQGPQVGPISASQWTGKQELA